jgi:hypothetical protein
MTAPGYSAQLFAQLQVVVNLAVKHDHVSPGARQHRLVAGRREVQDGKPRMAEAESSSRITPDTGIVWAAIS